MAEQVQKKSRGCLLYGAITMALVFIGVVAGLYFGARKAILMGVDTYTSSAPVPVPQVNIPPGEQQRIARDLARKAQQASQGRGPEQIVLSEPELNVLLAQAPDLQAYRRQIYLQAESNRLKAQISLPLDQFEHWKSLSRKLGRNLGNRHLNGTAYFDVGITNGALALRLVDLVANGKSLPEEFTKRVEAQTFAAAANNNPQTQQILQRVEAIDIQDGKVIVKFQK